MQLSSLVSAAPKSAGIQQAYVESHPHPSWVTGHPTAHQSAINMSSALVSNPYANQQNITYTYSQAQQRPPSPPSDEAKKCSLPSISSLIESVTPENGSEQGQQQNGQSNRAAGEAQSQSHVSEPPSNVSNSRVLLPPTPPPRPGSGFDMSNQSPTTIPAQASFPASASMYYSAPAINNIEPHAQRQMTYPPIPQKRPSLPSQGHSPYTTSSYGSPSALSASSYHASPVEASPSSTLYYQRPLPGNFPPVAYTPPPPQLLPFGNPSPWQHHHGFPPSATAPYPQSPDRYICQTCNKAFSRPSSLKIHSHSHTGEKPYKCPHAGCGKAFSVRSNMKRHEKGCHGGDGGSVRDISPGSI